MSAPPGRKVVVLSPHSDDAVFSLGAAIAAWAGAGAEVTVLTVYANVESSTGPAGPWDAACGFATEGEAASARRDEDRRACAQVGATPSWLAFRDEQYGPGPDDEVAAALASELEQADVVLVPGFPLDQPDHRRLSDLVLERRLTTARIGLYVEQPYAALRLMGRGRRTWTAPGLSPRRGLSNAIAIALRTASGRRLVRPAAAGDWRPLPRGVEERRAKGRAARAYSSQLRAMGPLVLARVALYEAAWGGEGVAWLS